MRIVYASLLTVCLVGSAFARSPETIDPYTPPDPNVEVPLEGEALTALFMDRTHRGYYNYGDWETTDPAFTERMNSDGTTRHQQDGRTDPGTWRTRETVVCFSYPSMNGGCFNVYQRGNCYYAMDAITKEFVAISVLDGETPDCEPSYA